MKARCVASACPQAQLKLKPLAAAVLAALPLLAMAQASKVPKLPPPSANAVPVPAASWRVYGTGGAAPTQRQNDKGGVDQTIRQDSSKAIYHWKSFDIGAKSSVLFDMALAGSSALNRVVGNANPTRVFGKLSATKNGEIYVINANGILFGRGAQVNVGSLIASGLDVTDDEFKSSLINAITSGQDSLTQPNALPAFKYGGLAEDFVDSRNFVRVDPGAQITTGSGGRVFLFAKRVENAGRIETPAGQTVLAAGDSIYLGLPTSTDFNTYYASEVNPDVPVLRGLVVEVGVGAGGITGSAWNAPGGHIVTQRGNTTIVGMAVNQSGRITATTSVSENGSIVLRAQGVESARQGKKTADVAGELVLGPSSVIEVLPDTSRDAQGKTPVSNDSAGFVTSRIDLTGYTVSMQDGAQVVAPGGSVKVFAEDKPRYEFADSVPSKPVRPGTDGARIVLGKDVLIDVSGTTDTVIDGARNFVTTELLVSNDLKDAPLQKDGLLYRSRATLDVRGSSPILGDLSSYRAALLRTVGERLAAGGSVSLVAGGGVVMHEDARIDVSGGRVRYTDTMVAPTRLMGTDGQLYTLNDASKDLVYAYAFNLQRPGDAVYDRWGLKVNYGSLLPAREELGYREGKDAGRLSVVAPTVVLAGQLDAHSTAGQRQQEGKDRTATPGRIELGAVFNGGEFFDASYAGAVLQDVLLTERAAIDDAAWSDPLLAPLPDVSQISLRTLQAGGFGSIDVAAVKNIELDTGTEALNLPVEGQLRLRSQRGDVSARGRITGAAARVELNSKQSNATLEDGSSIDVSGRWLNQHTDGPLDTRATRGGEVVLSGLGAGVGKGSKIDVSGGAAVSVDGKQTIGGDAGSIRIDARPPIHTLGATRPVTLDGELRGYSMATGGHLEVTASTVRITDRPPVAEAAPVSLTLGSGFFEQGGFSSYAIDGRRRLEVSADARVTPQRDVYIAPADPALEPSGHNARRVLKVGQDPLSLPQPVNLELTSSGGGSQNRGNDIIGGLLQVEAGASIVTVPQSKVNLTAAHRLRFDGSIVNRGGDVTLALAPPNDTKTAPNFMQLGSTSSIDVSGAVQLDPVQTALRTGTVLAGGNVTLDANGKGIRGTTLAWLPGAQIDVRGARGMLDVTEQTEGGASSNRRRVASDGGSLQIIANRDLFLDGELHAQSAAPGAAGGRLSVTLTRDPLSNPDTADGLPPERELRVVQNRRTTSPLSGAFGGPPELTGDASVSAELVRTSGVSDFSVGATDRVMFEPGVALSLDRTLSVEAPAIGVVYAMAGAAPSGTVTLSAPIVRLANLAAFPQPINEKTPALPLPTTGDARLQVNAGHAILDGRIATLGVGQLHIAATGDVRLQGPVVGDTQRPEGTLLTNADVRIDAARVYPASNTRYTINAEGRSVAFGTPEPAGRTAAHGSNGAGRSTIGKTDVDAARDAPLSAGGTLIVQADTIQQGGVVRAPHGHIELHAATSLTLETGSVTSVSADGKDIPYGRFDNDRTWRPPGDQRSALTQPPDKQIVLDAPAGTIDSRPGSTLDLSGGGELLAWQFVPGPGGSHDVFAGGDGSFAIVPSIKGLAPHDAGLAPTGAALGKQIVFGPGGPLPAGSYTLLPARYALLDGGYLVRPESSGGPALGSGVALKQTDGSTVVGARLADGGTGFADALASNWRITPRADALKSSEIRTAEASQFFNAIAMRDGVAAPRLPVDAGMLTIRAAAAELEGTTRFDVPVAAKGEVAGRGGIAQIAADRIRVVGNGAAQQNDALNIRASQLSAMGAGTLLLGATRGAAIADPTGNAPSVGLDVVANEVVIANGGESLKVNDLVVTARDRLQIDAGSQIESIRTAAGGIEAYAVDGDGAALRLAATGGAGLTRTGVQRAGGDLNVADGAGLQAAGGTLVLDSTRRTQLGRQAQLTAADLTISAGRMAVRATASGTSDDGALVVGATLASQLSAADALTLRAYDGIDFADGSALALDLNSRVTLDTPQLRVGRADDKGASVTAGSIALANSSGERRGVSGAADGTLMLNASGTAPDLGRIEFGNGQVAVAGNAVLTAKNEAALVGEGRLRVGGDLSVDAPVVRAATPLAEVTLQANGALNLSGNGKPGTHAAASGAALSLIGQSVAIGGDIALPAGQLQVEARGPAAADGIHVSNGARIDVAGRRLAVGPQHVDVAGGSIDMVSAAGGIALDRNTTLTVDGVGTAGAGRIALQAPQGNVRIEGQLQGASARTADGGQLSIDSMHAVDLAQLSERIAQNGRSGFRDRISVRNRAGDQQVDAGTTLTAREITLQADGGALRVAGTLNADHDKGGSLMLGARDDVTLAAGAEVLARATKADSAGGRVELHSSTGTLRLDAGSSIDVSGRGPASAGNVGRVLLRAPRTGVATPADAGDDVQIAPLAGTIRGAEWIDVEAVKVYEGSNIVQFAALPGDIGTAQIANDGLAFVGNQGQNASAIAGRLANGNASLQKQLRVHAGAELRSDGDLNYLAGSEWQLPTESLGTGHANVGDTSVSLRAAGTLSFTGGFGVTSGFDGSHKPVSYGGGSIRLTSGADLQAALPGSTKRDGAGDVLLGRFTPESVSLATTIATSTGDIQVAAAHDVRLGKHVGIYSYGRPIANAQAQQVADELMRVDPNAFPLFPGPDDDVSPFRVGGGKVGVTAGRDVRAHPALIGAGLVPGEGLYGAPELWTLADWRLTSHAPAEGDGSSPLGEIGAWWGSHQHGPRAFTWSGKLSVTHFQHGLATMAGGDVDVSAGRNILDLHAATASSGYWLHPVDGSASKLKTYAGGNLRVDAGRNVVNGEYFSGGDRLQLHAREFEAVPRVDKATGGVRSGTDVLHENTAVSVLARRDALITALRPAFATNGQWLWGLDGDAQVELTAVGGSVTHTQSEDYVDSIATSRLVAAHIAIQAPQGDVSLPDSSGVIQQPVTDGSMRLVAAGNLTVAGPLVINATRTEAPLGYADGRIDGLSNLPQVDLTLSAQNYADSGTGMDRSKRDPVQLVALGDLNMGSISSARPVQLTAGGNIDVAPGRVVTIQHQAERWDAAHQRWQPQDELSFMRAGGDISLQLGSSMAVRGSGDVALLAGRSINVGTAEGLVSNGNNDNALVLPPGGANLTLVAGLRADGADYAVAVRKGFQALGGLSLTDRAGDLYAQLSKPERLVPLGSADAKHFDAADLNTQLALTRELVGARTYDAAIAGYVRGLPGNERLSDRQALAEFDRLSPGLRNVAPGVVLSASFATHDAALRHPYIAQIAALPPAKGEPDRSAQLISYLKRTTGVTYALADAVAAFEALPLERQIPLLNDVLVQDLRTNGRAAVRTTGDEQAIAYARGYRAIDALFPVDRPAGDVVLPTTQIRTLQGGSIQLMVPGGSVNAGETTLAVGDPKKQGIVTVAGGNISAVVRDDFLVNRSRVFTLAEGDILLWSSQGNIDAGRGAKTIVGAPTPVLRLDPVTGKLYLDVSGSFTGSGIAVLNAASDLDLYAPEGAIDAGEAGIRASGNAFFGAQVIRGADDIQVGGVAAGVSPAPPTSAGITGLDTNLQAAANKAVESNDSEEERRRRRAQRQLLLEFLGYGQRS